MTTSTYKISYPQTPFLDPNTQMPSLPWQLWLQNPSVSSISVGGNSSGGTYTGIAITDSTVDNTPIGATTPSTGSFSSLTSPYIYVEGNISLSYQFINATSGSPYTFGFNTVMILNASTSLSGITITMPASPINGQIATIVTNQPISSLTVSANTGQTINDPATSLGGGAGASYIYTSSGAWFRLY